MATDLSALKTPGVYVQEISLFPPSVAAVETAIPAFIGYTERTTHPTAGSLINNPIRITSMVEYSAIFGGPQPEEGITVTVSPTGTNTPDIAVTVDATKLSKFKMVYSLQFYFANGGGPCYIVSVGTYGATVDTGDLATGTGLLGGLSASDRIDEVTLIVFPDSQGISTIDNYYGLYSAALDSCVTLQDRFVIMDVYKADDLSDPTQNPVENLRTKLSGPVDKLKYGAAYYPNLDTTLDYSIDDTKVTVGGNQLSELKEGQNALYFQILAAIRDTPMRMTPSAGMAGIYANVDSLRGVWKAPANVNMNLVIRPSQIITDAQQEPLNVDTNSGKSVNVIRSFTGRGSAIVWGARTLAGNDNEWRYIPVRRFCNMVEESVKKACGQFVFEPNDANTWVRVRAMIENFLILQWRAGALQGAKPDQAFYVAVGLNQTMTALDVLEGRMIVEIGMAIVRPAEFIILRFSQLLPQS